MGILDGKVIIVTGSAKGMGAAEAQHAAENGAEVLGRIDGLVNYAGVYTSQDIFSGSAGAFQRIVEVNQFGTYLGMSTVAPIMSRQ